MTVMFKNYLKVTLRNIGKHKAYSFINISGLAVGMAASMLILLFVQDELSFDRYHENADRVYRVAMEGIIQGRHIRSATTPAPMAATFIEEYPEVVNATRIWDSGRVLVGFENNRFYEDRFFWADSTVFDVFTFPLVQGDPGTALTQPNTVVITEAMARKYFGDANPMGKTLSYDNRVDYVVTGIVAEIPSTSHFLFDFLGSILTEPRASSPLWINNSFYTYLLLQEDFVATHLEGKFPSLVNKYIGPQVEQALGISFEEAVASGLSLEYFLQPLTDIYLRSDVENDVAPMSDISYVYILSAIAVFILLIACFNFMNLATARSANRAKEVGLRKVMGSDRSRLIWQFLGESVLLASVALLLAVILIISLLPAFGHVAGKTLSLSGPTIVSLIGIALGAGFFAGMYPAFVLSAFRPAAVLKGNTRTGAGSQKMRDALVVLQFAISITLLIGTGIVYNQLDFMHHYRLGFAQEQVVVLPIEMSEARQQYEAFRTELLQHHNVLHVAASNVVPGRFNWDGMFRLEGAPTGEVHNMSILRASHEYLETLDIKMAAGRVFSRDFATDAGDALILNETAVHNLGRHPEDILGKKIENMSAGPNGEDIPYTIIGVVEDFHFESLHRNIKPLTISIDPNAFYYVSIRIGPDRLPETLAFLQQQWLAFEPTHPYRYFFLDEDFSRLYEREARLGRIYGYFTVLAVVIACLGLFGLASFITEQRTKEIGVRKVLGASVVGIVVLLSMEFTKLVLIAAVVAFPIAYLVMARWLQDFAYHTEISWGIFLLAGLAALGIAWLTVGYQSVRSAVADPVKSLRYE